MNTGFKMNNNNNKNLQQQKHQAIKLTLKISVINSTHYDKTRFGKRRKDEQQNLPPVFDL